jgi:hypothetical protein
VTSGGKGVTELNDLITAQPVLEQAVADAADGLTSTRTGLRTPATNVDRLNKRFYSKLQRPWPQRGQRHPPQKPCAMALKPRHWFVKGLTQSRFGWKIPAEES